MRRTKSRGVGKAFERVLLGEDDEERAGLESVLMSPVRQRLFAFLCRYPGSPLKTVSAANDISRSTASWHLRQLMEAGYINQRNVRNKVTFSPAGLVDEKDTELLELLNNETAKNLFLTILSQPGLSQRELAKMLGTSDQSILRLVRRMEGLDLISRTTDGRFVRYFPSDGLKRTKDRNYKREKEFRKDILRKLETDGLEPKIVRQSDTELMVEIQRSRFKSVLDLSVDPFRTVLE
jgi:DNA-binding MarR family transcriptional regulator